MLGSSWWGSLTVGLVARMPTSEPITARAATADFEFVIDRPRLRRVITRLCSHAGASRDSCGRRTLSEIGSAVRIGTEHLIHGRGWTRRSEADKRSGRG